MNGGALALSESPLPCGDTVWGLGVGHDSFIILH